jgi:hypothetical protein
MQILIVSPPNVHFWKPDYVVPWKDKKSYFFSIIIVLYYYYSFIFSCIPSPFQESTINNCIKNYLNRKRSLIYLI